MPDAGEGNLTSLVLSQRPNRVLWDHHLSRNHFGFGVLPNHGRIIAHTENDMANKTEQMANFMAFMTGDISEAELAQRLTGKSAKQAKPSKITLEAKSIGVSERSKNGDGKQRYQIQDNWGTLYGASGEQLAVGSTITIKIVK